MSYMKCVRSALWWW